MPNQAQGGAPASTAPRPVGLAACAALVVANMVGTGIFTSLGFQIGEIPSRPAIMALWTLGGILALCGALCYAELSAALPRSGGEYHFLGQIYHPSLGFMAGVVSLVVGFAAPVALSAMAFGSYLHGVFPGVSPIAASMAVVIIVTLFHLRDLRLSSIFQILFTVLKIGLVLFLIAALFAAPGTASAAAEPWSSYLLTAPFAVSLMFTLYAYSGWNAATYILGEVRTPARIIPAALTAGTLLVMALYLGLNAAFLHVAPTALLAGQLNVAQVAAEAICPVGLQLPRRARSDCLPRQTSRNSATVPRAALSAYPTAFFGHQCVCHDLHRHGQTHRSLVRSTHSGGRFGYLPTGRSRTKIPGMKRLWVVLLLTLAFSAAVRAVSPTELGAFLAGRQLPPSSPLAALQDSSEYRQHAREYAAQWYRYDDLYFAPMRSWASTELVPRIGPRIWSAPSRFFPRQGFTPSADSNPSAS